MGEESYDKRAASAIEMAKKQRSISVAEFFEKNRHLLGFDNPRKALLTAIKEAVDNSLDACEEAGILPEIIVEIVDMGKDRFHVTIEDNGPGIVKKQLPNIFAKLLYGSKFHSLRQSRGQQGIGISAAVLYAQLTTGYPAKIRSRISPSQPANYLELKIDTQKNEPMILKEEEVAWKKEQGTRIELDLIGSYLKGPQSVDEYLKETAITNPHVTIIYTNPKAEQQIFARMSEKVPPQAKEIQPHPYGVEIGRMLRMLRDTKTVSLQQFLCEEFCRVGPQAAKEICENSSLIPKMKPQELEHAHAEKLIEGIAKTKLISPPVDCINPIGEELLELGLRKEIKAEFYCATTRKPEVYRGNPFIIEAAIAYGGEIPADKAIKIMRFANRVPLLYQQGACAITESIQDIAWRPYGLSQSQGAIPIGPAAVVIHMASVWTPYTSEAKEAIAHYPEIIKEIKLAIQECGRKLGSYVSKKRRMHMEQQRTSLFETYIPEAAHSLEKLTGVRAAVIVDKMTSMAERNKELAKAKPEDGEAEQDVPSDDMEPEPEQDEE